MAEVKGSPTRSEGAAQDSLPAGARHGTARIGIASALDATPSPGSRRQRSIVGRVASFSYKGQDSDVLLEGTPNSFEKSLKSEFRILADKESGGSGRNLKYRLQDEQFPKGVVVTPKWLLEKGRDAEGRKVLLELDGDSLVKGPLSLTKQPASSKGSRGNASSANLTAVAKAPSSVSKPDEKNKNQS